MPVDTVALTEDSWASDIQCPLSRKDKDPFAFVRSMLCKLHLDGLLSTFTTNAIRVNIALLCALSHAGMYMCL